MPNFKPKALLSQPFSRSEPRARSIVRSMSKDSVDLVEGTEMGSQQDFKGGSTNTHSHETAETNFIHEHTAGRLVVQEANTEC